VVATPRARGRRRANPDFAHPQNRPAATRGTFRAPNGRLGTMSGSMRLHRLALVSGRVRAVGVFTGELFDSDGSSVGVGSRRTVAPADVVRSAAGISVTVGPLDVDLLGLAVSVEEFTLELGTTLPVVRDDPDRLVDRAI